MTALRTAQLEKSTLSRHFFVQASIPSRLASDTPPPTAAPITHTYTHTHTHTHTHTGNICIAQYDVRSPHTTRLPRYAHVFFTSCSVPFYPVVRICRQTAAKLRMQGYYTCTLFYVSKLRYIRACKRICSY